MRGHNLKRGDTVQVRGVGTALDGARGLIESVQSDVLVVQLDDRPFTLLFLADELVKL